MTSQPLRDLDKGEIQLNGSFDHQLFTKAEMNDLLHIITSGVQVVYIGATVFALIAFLLATMLQKNKVRH